MISTSLVSVADLHGQILDAPRSNVFHSLAVGRIIGWHHAVACPGIGALHWKILERGSAAENNCNPMLVNINYRKWECF